MVNIMDKNGKSSIHGIFMAYFMIFTLGFLQKDVENPWFPTSFH
jgi:hypothetical protein